MLSWWKLTFSPSEVPGNSAIAAHQHWLGLRGAIPHHWTVAGLGNPGSLTTKPCLAMAGLGPFDMLHRRAYGGEVILYVSRVSPQRPPSPNGVRHVALQ